MNPESLLESLALLVVSFTSGKMKLTIKVRRMRNVREEHMKTYTVAYSFSGGKQTTSPGIDKDTSLL